jgi:stearoyl-CoA desaturase (delta-9 desaturase)
VWSAGHRIHHRFIDDPERDPYCARRGFWFSHIGWMLRNYPSGDPDLKYVRELQSDPLVAFQHRHYLAIALGMNIGVPILMGWAFGDILGTVLLAGILRLVISHHLTFCINSLAHIIGARPYSTENTARDNGVVALLTFGEGYHNFHHMFAHDYRNGVRWWQWDPSKWLIGALQWAGLAKNLKRVPWFKIQRALLDTQFRRAQLELARQGGSPRLDELRRRVAENMRVFAMRSQRGPTYANSRLQKRSVRWLIDGRNRACNRGSRLWSTDCSFSIGACGSWVHNSALRTLDPEGTLGEFRR